MERKVEKAPRSLQMKMGIFYRGGYNPGISPTVKVGDTVTDSDGVRWEITRLGLDRWEGMERIMSADVIRLS